MRKYLLFIFTFCLLPLSAQNSADKLLQKTVSKLEKDGGISMKLDAEVKNEGTTDHIELEIKLSPDGSFYANEDDNIMWFDGMTMWRGNDFGDGIEEIYITEPTPEEKEKYDIIGLLRKHQGFSVSGNGSEMFILTASNAERSVEGISKVTVTVDPSTYVIRSLSVQFDQGIGNISVTAKVTEYSPGQKFDKSTFICPVKDYKDADIINLR
jgi:outer membrane lipoprotein-sorting protein